MLAMVMAAAVPALAQTQAGQGNAACVQNAANVEIGKVQISQYGDNINIQQIAQECNITVAQVNTVIAEAAGSASATATASASAAPSVQYQYQAAAAQYQYASASAAAEELPSTGGSSLIALGAGVLLVAGGLLARRIVR
jgi:LPXTG-motif cell wall-anchored protein